MKNTVWKKLGSKLLLKHSRITIYEDQVELPNGHKTTYLHYANSLRAAMVIAKRNDGKILLQREYSYPPNKWLYQFPGGKVNENEEIEVGAQREFAEEAGLTGELSSLGSIVLDNRRSDTVHYVYLATNLTPSTAKGDLEEDIESYWFSENEIDQMIKSGAIENGSALAGWALYKASA